MYLLKKYLPVFLLALFIISCSSKSANQNDATAAVVEEVVADQATDELIEEAADDGKDKEKKKKRKKVKPTFKVKEDGLYAEIQTNRGNILAELFFDQTPMTVMNFVGLAEGTLKNSIKGEGEPFYDGLKFHRVIDKFMIQGGDPQGTGSGGPGYKFPDEMVPGVLRHDSAGILSMANSGPHTNGSQFFITHVPTPWLNGGHTVFGTVVEGLDIVNSVAQNDVIEHIVIIRKGKEAKKFEATDEAFAKLQSEGMKTLKQRYSEYTKKLAEELANGKEVMETGDGLYYFISEKGNGPKPQRDQKVSAKYHGKFDDGKTFDQGEYSFKLETGSVIQGWHLGFSQLNQGDKATLVIPYWYGYGERSGQLPGRSILVFDVELMSIK